MTIGPILDTAYLYAGQSNPNPQKVEAGDDFQNIMNSATEKKDSYMQDLPVASKNIETDDSTKDKMTANVKSENTKADSEESKVSEKNDNKINEKDSDSLSTGHKEVAEDNKENVSGELKDKILNEAAKDLGISVEELENLLTTLGLTAADLVNPENVSTIVAEVMTEGDKLSLLTDENAAKAVLELNNAIDGIVMETAELNEMTPQDLKAFVLSEQTTEVKAETTIEVNAQQVSADGEKIIVSENPGMLDKVQKLDDPKNTESTSTVENKEMLQTEEEIVKVDTSEKPETGKDNQSDKDSLFDNKTAGEANTQSVFQMYSEDVNFDEAFKPELETRYSTVDPQEILDQVRDSIRTNIRDNITEISMQLNPETLGTVGLTISAKEGAVTAHLTAQNESVQAALETQVAILKESLENQGVKVEAIEITAESHGFEQNLEQGNDSNEAQEKMEAELKKATRRLNINGELTDEDIEGLDEETVVTAKMMAADGNRMDYKV